jgi:transposase InsO family protein
MGKTSKQKFTATFKVKRGRFTSDIYTLFENGIQPSMDGKGRAIDNIFVERLWRSVKYEYIYLWSLTLTDGSWKLV